MEGSPAPHSGLPFSKLHGCANDYVLVDAIAHPVSDPAALARAVADRRRGVGADGLLLAVRSERADVRMRMFNPDGSEAEMCGNGLRCLARFAADHGLVPDPFEMSVETGAGVLRVTADAADGLLTIDMGVPQLDDAEGRPGSLRLDGVEVQFTAVSMGNPHAVLFVDDVETAPVDSLGPRLERAERFPQRTNVEFVEVLARDAVRQRTWERGAGETLACGTGACAVAVASVLAGHTDREITVHLRGGDLQVRWAEDGHVFLRGPAVEVFTGVWPRE